MAGVLLNPTQIDSKSGILTLFGPNSTDPRSVSFAVNDKPYTLVGFNLGIGQKATLYNVAQIQGTTRESLFTYNGNKIELTADNPTALVAVTGVYRLVLNSPVGNCVVRAYPQDTQSRPVAPLNSDIINSVTLDVGASSYIVQVTYRAVTITAYGLLTGEVTVFSTYEGKDAYVGTLTPTNTTMFLDKTGDYRFTTTEQCVLTLRPNYVDFDNPYVVQGPAGEQGPPGYSGGAITFMQNTASDTWVINHNLGRKVAASVYTMGGVEMLAQTINISDNQLQVLFDGPYNGYAVVE